MYHQSLFLICSVIIISITFHDISVSKSVIYRLLINEAISDENPFFLPADSISENEIISEINKAVDKAYNREKLEGLQYTNGNLYREV